MVEAEHPVRNRLEDRPDLRIRLEQFLRAQLHRAFHQLTIDHEFRIRAVDRGDEAVPLGGDAEVIAEEAFQLTLQQTLRGNHVQLSANVVMVMVWLCSSLRSPSENGAISP